MAVAADLSGNWIATVAGGQGEPQYTRVSLTIDGDKLGGMWGESTISGTLADGKLSVALSDAQGTSAGNLSGAVAGETITGSGTITGGRGGRAGGFGGGGGGGMRPGGGAAEAAEQSRSPWPARQRRLRLRATCTSRQRISLERTPRRTSRR
ncbi:MAG TPA: hypothetical protein VII58_08100 [Acidobacteriaceae bacterium]